MALPINSHSRLGTEDPVSAHVKPSWIRSYLCKPRMSSGWRWGWSRLLQAASSLLSRCDLVCALLSPEHSAGGCKCAFAACVSVSPTSHPGLHTGHLHSQWFSGLILNVKKQFGQEEEGFCACVKKSSWSSTSHIFPDPADKCLESCPFPILLL